MEKTKKKQITTIFDARGMSLGTLASADNIALIRAASEVRRLSVFFFLFVRLCLFFCVAGVVAVVVAIRWRAFGRRVVVVCVAFFILQIDRFIHPPWFSLKNAFRRRGEDAAREPTGLSHINTLTHTKRTPHPLDWPHTHRS